MTKTLRDSTVIATDDERRRIGILSMPPMPKNTAKVSLIAMTAAASFVLAHAKDDAARAAMHKLFGNFEGVRTIYLPHPRVLVHPSPQTSHPYPLLVLSVFPFLPSEQ